MVAATAHVTSNRVFPTRAEDGAPDDDSLVTAIVRRDEAALRALYERYGGAVAAVATKVLRDVNLAEDVVQDVFVSFWREPESYDPRRGGIRTFLVVLAHRRAVDVVRSEEARRRRESRPPDPTFYDVADEIVTQDLGSAVHAALESLAPAERDAIALAYFGGLSYVQVADRLGAPEGTVKSRIRNGMRRLSSSLSGYR